MDVNKLKFFLKIQKKNRGGGGSGRAGGVRVDVNEVLRFSGKFQKQIVRGGGGGGGGGGGSGGCRRRIEVFVKIQKKWVVGGGGVGLGAGVRVDVNELKLKIL